MRMPSTVAKGLIRIDVRSVAFFGVLLALIGLGGWLYLQQASEVASLAHEIRVLERDKERLHREITALQGEVAMLGSLERVLEAGAQLGYVMPEAFDQERRLRVVYEPLAEPTAIPDAIMPASAPTTPQEALTAGGAEGFVQRMVEQLREWIATPVDDDELERPLEDAP